MTSRPHRPYRLIFGERTILLEGYLAFGGVIAWIVGRATDVAWLERAGVWMTAPFVLTIAIALVVLAPFFWWRGRARSADEN